MRPLLLATALVLVMRGLTAAGRVDRRFGRRGVALVPLRARDIRQLVPHGDDGLILAGGDPGTYRLTRIRRDGSPDRGFGDRGTAGP